ncbi:BON domain-containing protein [Legionella cardiaca]|uniref:BON domain-containing protein n=1 Tax=Legionella cardiaca TaxID=1071983 RepID=A0ABY8ASC1_9GAMM|nr:BON domain-containing protein [Legionella cardiaca]WED43579.1 BON domain-containing protein [Legionella cardiaca]
MRKYYRILLVGIGFILTVGCQQTITGESIFSPRSSDDAITASVNQAMMRNRILVDVPVHVETHQGNVMLSGYVKTIRQSDTAGDIALKVPGVKTVQNNLIVRKY